MITPVLICGGIGKRLWPLSRASYPKQFVPFDGELSLFQTCAQRLSGDDYDAPIIVTNSDFRFIVAEQLAHIGIEPGAILIEPEARNTCPAVLAASLYLQREKPNTIMLVAPTDHLLPNVPLFQSTVSASIDSAKDDKIVCFGIQPNEPKTGYGYLDLGDHLASSISSPVPLNRFVEKPDATTAKEMVESGKYLWNSGMFLFSINTILKKFNHHVPQMMLSVEEAIERSKVDFGFIRLAAEPWSKIDNISIDYAMLEKCDNLVAITFSGKWNDLGDWDSVWAESQPNSEGVVTSRLATAIDCKDVLLRSESENQIVVGIGLNDVLVIAMPDAVLVIDKSRAQDVQEAVKQLSESDLLQADKFPRDYRPWGYFDSLNIGTRFQVKKIVVKPGASLSLQSHKFRAEHWIVVEGTAKVTIDGKSQIVEENQSVYVPLGAIHRLANPADLPMVLIEVQSGTYFGEDDIVRYEDVYTRK